MDVVSRQNSTESLTVRKQKATRARIAAAAAQSVAQKGLAGATIEQIAHAAEIVNQALQALGVVDGPVKLLFNFAGLLIAMTHIFLPFMVLVLIGAIQNIPRDVEDAARVLGASWGSAFLRVTLPLSAPGILSGSILVFVLTISALVTPRLLGGPTYQVMSTLIFDEFLQRLNWPAGSAQALLLTIMVLTLVYLSGRLARRTGARA